jgi:proteasome lid subunit RPN8/RPN11
MKKNPVAKLTYAVPSGRSSMEFGPHRFSMKVERGPIVTVSQSAYDEMRLLVDECEIEIGWMGIADKTETGFHVSEIFVPKQKCHDERTRFEPDAMFDILKELKARGIDKSRLRFWGHSHVRYETTPSEDDWRQTDVFSECDWMLTAIANKFGNVKFMVHYYDYGLSIGDIPWMMAVKQLDDSKRREVRDLILRQVSILKKPKPLTEEEIRKLEAEYAQPQSL